MRSKYIVIDVKGYPEAIIFPETLNHRDVAIKFCNKKEDNSINFDNVLGAGFVGLRIDENKSISAMPYGESVDLSKVSREEDKNPIEKSLGIYISDLYF